MKVKRTSKKKCPRQTQSRLKVSSKKSFKKSGRGNQKKKSLLSKSRAQKKIFFGSPRMAQNVKNEQNNPRPSTSREATESRSTLKSAESPERTPVKKKTFVKFKDDKHRTEFIEKYKLSSLRRFPFKSNGITSPSLSQAISRKIVHQIKKRQNNNNNNNKSVNKTTMPDKTDEKPQSTTSDNLDEDCICIEAKTEVILIEDESMAPVNVVKELENKYRKLKQYQAIGSIRMNQNQTNKHMQILTSTPNADRGKASSTDVLFNEESDSRFGSISSDTICCNSEDVTVVEDVNGQFDDVIVIDDTITPRNNSRQRHQRHLRKRHMPKIDDSVIFVKGNIIRDSSIVPPAPAFIPLNTPAEEVRIRVPPPSPSPPRAPRPKRKCNDLFTSREEKQLRQYNGNAYNPDKDGLKQQPKKRMVIVDGSNVAYHHSLMKEFSVKGLKICLDYFDKIGHEVKAVVPQYRLQRLRSTDPDELDKLHKAGKIVLTPCKNLPGKSSTSYDDRFVLQLASELDAAIVSNDNYRDLLNENPAFKKIIENRVIGYTWCNDIFILPKDPYGRSGPQLDAILNRS